MRIGVHCDAVLDRRAHQIGPRQRHIPSDAFSLQIAPTRLIADKDRASRQHRFEDHEPETFVGTRKKAQSMTSKEITHLRSGYRT